MFCGLKYSLTPLAYFVCDDLTSLPGVTLNKQINLQSAPEASDGVFYINYIGCKAQVYN